jgi:GNAT superfamily N-acetyltransferase
MTDLSTLLDEIARGEFPPTDMGVTHVRQPSEREAAVLATTAHAIVAADVAPEWLAEHLPPGDPGAAFNPPFLGALEAETGRRVNNIDMLFISPSRSGPPELSLSAVHDHDHPRVRRATRYRDDVTVFTCDGGVLVIGRGLAGRWEVGLEVSPEYRGRGLGRAMAAAAAHLVPDDSPLWAQIGVGNIASIRAFLAAGFTPVAEETLLVRHRSAPES